MYDGQFYPYQPIQFMDGLLAPPIGAEGYAAQGVNFDGTNDYLTRGADLTGAADGKLQTGSFWIRLNSGGGATQVVYVGVSAVGGSTTGTRIQFQTSDNKIVFAGSRPGSIGTNDMLFRTTTAFASRPTAWLHLMWSVDMSDTGKRWLYLNDVSDILVNTYNNLDIDFTFADWGIGGTPGGTNKLTADIADFMWWPGVYTDLSVEANRRLFISAEGKPVLPAVPIAALGTPMIAQYGPTAAWETNKGSGGGFTENGALTDSANGPSA